MLTFPFNFLFKFVHFQLRLPSLPFREPDPSQKCLHFLSILSLKLVMFRSGCLPSLSGPLFRSTENQAAPRYAAISGSGNKCFGRRLIQRRLAAWAASHTNSKQFGGFVGYNEVWWPGGRLILRSLVAWGGPGGVSYDFS